MKNKEVTFSMIEAFILNNRDLANINAYISRFNPIKVMGMEHMEIRHSKILGWLLDPRGNHGLGDEFLKAFLSEALRGEYNKNLNSLDISNTSLIHSNAYIEWNRIDIFVECPEQKWAFVIENKIYAKQSKDQLMRYRKHVESRYSDHRVIGVFLTLEDEIPDDKAYCQIQYPSVVTILEGVLEQKYDSLSERIANFIKYYLDILGELTRMNKKQSEMELLARKVYQEHREVLEYLFEHGKKDEFETAIETFISPESPLKVNDKFSIGSVDYEFIYASKNWYRFLPTSWIEAIGRVSKKDFESENFKWKGCEDWFPYPIICWLELYGDSTIRLQVEVGPISDHDTRKSLINCIKQNFKESKFQKTATDSNRKYSRFYTAKKTINDSQDIEKMHKIFEQLFTKEFYTVSKHIEQGLIQFSKTQGKSNI